MNGPASGLLGSPKVLANWVQFETRIGVLTGPPGARPTKAAIEVPTPSIGFDCAGVSSPYTPGVRYVGISHSLSTSVVVLELVQQGVRRAGGDPPRLGATRVVDVHLRFVAGPQDELRGGCGHPGPASDERGLARVERQHDRVGLKGGRRPRDGPRPRL